MIEGSSHPRIFEDTEELMSEGGWICEYAVVPTWPAWCMYF